MLNTSSQTKFDSNYITAAEITKELGISRAGFLYGRRSGKLPYPIIVSEGRIMLWERTPEILAMVASWKEAIISRKLTEQTNSYNYEQILEELKWTGQ